MAKREYEVTLTVNVVVAEEDAEEAEREFEDVGSWETLFLGETTAWSRVWSVEVGSWVEV